MLVVRAACGGDDAASGASRAGSRPPPRRRSSGRRCAAISAAPSCRSSSTCICRRSARPTAMPGPALRGGPAELAARYLEERLYRDNPIVQRGRSGWWSRSTGTRSTERTDPARTLRSSRSSGRRGSGTAWAFRCYGPDGRRGQCGLGFRDGVRRLEPAVLTEYWQVCELAHLRFCALVLPTLGAPPKLSRREAEVLGWVARGKSNALIGGHPGHFGGDGRCAPAADLPQARGFRPDQRGGAGDRDRADSCGRVGRDCRKMADAQRMHNPCRTHAARDRVRAVSQVVV